MTQQKISIRIPEEMVKFFEETGGGARGRSKGVRLAGEFAQFNKKAFAAFLFGILDREVRCNEVEQCEP